MRIVILKQPLSRIRETLAAQLDELLTLDTDQLLARRYEKLMGFGIA